MEEADDYYFPPVTGTYLRLTRFLIATVTLISCTPLFLLLMQNPEVDARDWLSFIMVKEEIQCAAAVGSFSSWSWPWTV